MVAKDISSGALRSGTGDDRGTTYFFGDRGRQRDNVFFHPAKVKSSLGGVAIFFDTIDDRRHLRSYGMWSTPGADNFRVRTVSFVV